MIPISYNLRNLVVRWKTTLMTGAGFTLVVAALIVMLAFYKGVQKACGVSGEPNNVLVLSKGYTDEILSELQHSELAPVLNAKGVLRGSDGRRLASRELYSVITTPNPLGDGYLMLEVRGVTPDAFKVHRQVRIAAGRMFEINRSEIVVGAAALKQHGLRLGSTLTMGHKVWRVVGVIEAEGAAFEAEIWCHLSEFASTFRRGGVCSSVVLRTHSPEAAERLVENLRKLTITPVEAMTEPAYYFRQARYAEPFQTAAFVIAVFMAFGVAFGVMTTMYAAVGQRRKEIAVMRLLGFGKGQILLSFLFEALLIAAFGGILGVAVGYATNGLTQHIELNGKEIAVAFQVDLQVILMAGYFALATGLLGGLLPARSAMKIAALEALR
jgi:putative ABC transport system permease protein